MIVCAEVHDDLNWLLLDGGDNLLQFSLLYLFFADSFQYLSLSKSARPRPEYAFSHFLTNIAVAAIIAHVCLAYLVSGLSKANAEVWNNGTAMYYILLNDRFRGTDWLNQTLANSVLFNFFVCYTTIIWESTFCFAVFVKRLRIPVLLMGIGMHLSIYILMMIQSFQTIYIFHYGFFFTDDEWLRFLANARARLTRVLPSGFLANARSSLSLQPAPTANIEAATRLRTSLRQSEQRSIYRNTKH